MKEQYNNKYSESSTNPESTRSIQETNDEKLKLNKSDTALKKMIIISVICGIFLVAELIGGIVANSLAIITDAAHLFSDLSGFFISILAICIGRKKPNSLYTYGYYRAEVLGALTSVITIWILTGVLLQEAFIRLSKPAPIYAPVMLFTAILGLICNLAMWKVLHSGPGAPHANCSHGHGNHITHDEKHHSGESIKQMNTILEIKDEEKDIEQE